MNSSGFKYSQWVRLYEGIKQPEPKNVYEEIDQKLFLLEGWYKAPLIDLLNIDFKHDWDVEVNDLIYKMRKYEHPEAYKAQIILAEKFLKILLALEGKE